MPIHSDMYFKYDIPTSVSINPVHFFPDGSQRGQEDFLKVWEVRRTPLKVWERPEFYSVRELQGIKVGMVP